jgi:hypothetical protein
MDKKVVEAFKDIAKEIIESGKGPINMIIFNPRDKRKKNEIIDAPFIDTVISKDLFASFVSYMLQTGKYESYIQISEVYIYPDGNKSKKSEALMFSFQNDKGDKEILMINFERVGTRIKYTKETTLDNTKGAEIQGRFAEMWK